jgi:predicted nuclease of predicted toxin-antitoxin system
VRSCCRCRSRGEFKLDENLPASSAVIFAGAGHDVDTVGQEGLGGAPDPEVVAAAGRVLVSLDVDIRACPPGSHAGIVVLRLTDQLAAAVSKAVSDLAALTNADGLAGAVSVLQHVLLRIRHP